MVAPADHALQTASGYAHHACRTVCISFAVKDDEGWFGADFPQGVDELYFQCHGVLKDEDRLKDLFDMFSVTLERLVQIDSAYQNDPKVVL